MWRRAGPYQRKGQGRQALAAANRCVLMPALPNTYFFCYILSLFAYSTSAVQAHLQGVLLSPAVSLDWLSACTTESRVLRTDRYLIRLRDDSEPPPMPGDAAASPSQHRVSDLRSSYPPTRLSRGRSSKEGSSQAAEPAGCSPKSPTSFLSQPFEILRSKKSSLTQQEAAEARFSAFQELAHSPGELQA